MTAHAKHAPEPWEVTGTRIYATVERPTTSVQDRHRGEVAVATKADPLFRYAADATAAHIVACVNACTGMADPATDIPAMRAALERVIAEIIPARERSPMADVIAQARAALSRAEVNP